ncbi:hypothetical protein LCGC14_0784320, partial [marine sediment metagenome]
EEVYRVRKKYINSGMFIDSKRGKYVHPSEINIVIDKFKKTIYKKPGCKICKRKIEIAEDGLCYNCYDIRFWERDELKPKKSYKTSKRKYLDPYS